MATLILLTATVVVASSLAALAVGVAPGLVIACQCIGLAGGVAAGYHIIGR